MSWTNEKEKIYQISKNNLKVHKVESIEERTNWKSYLGLEYISQYHPDTLADYKKFFSNTDSQYKEYLKPILVSIMKNREFLEKQDTEREKEEKQIMIPEYRYNF